MDAEVVLVGVWRQRRDSGRGVAAGREEPDPEVATAVERELVIRKQDPIEQGC